MPLTPETVMQVARLARLELSDEEIILFTRQLNDILQYVEKLQELDTTGVEPMAHVLELTNIMRPDAVRPSLPPEAALENAPRQERQSFLVPRVI